MEREEAQQLVVEAIHNTFVDDMADLILDAYAAGQRDAIDELASLRARIAAAIAECVEVEADAMTMRGERVLLAASRRIRAKLEGR